MTVCNILSDLIYVMTERTREYGGSFCVGNDSLLKNLNHYRTACHVVILRHRALHFTILLKYIYILRNTNSS